MVTQANAQETTNALPPSARDFDAYRLVKVERQTTREAAKMLRISQTRVCQLIARVGEYLVDVTEPESEERRAKQLAVAVQVAAAEIEFCKDRAQRSFDGVRKLQTIREERDAKGQTTCLTLTKEISEEPRYLTTIARLAVIGSKLPGCTLPIGVRQTCDEEDVDLIDEVVDGEIIAAAPEAVAEVESPSEEACSDASDEVCDQADEEFASEEQKLAAIRLYNFRMQALGLPERQIPEPVQPVEPNVKMEQRPLTKLERKRLKRDRRKQRSAAKAS